MFLRLLSAWLVMALCVTIHAGGVSAALRFLPRHPRLYARAFHLTWLFITIAGWMILLHLLEIAAWAALFTLNGAIPEFTSAIYFSAVTYTTTGYGDIVLPPEWRLLGGVEALTGILMCGWSTGFFFAVVSRMFDGKRQV